MPKSVDRYRTGRWSFSKKEAADIGWILVGYWLDIGWILVGFFQFPSGNETIGLFS